MISSIAFAVAAAGTPSGALLLYRSSGSSSDLAATVPGLSDSAAAAWAEASSITLSVPAADTTAVFAFPSGGLSINSGEYYDLFLITDRTDAGLARVARFSNQGAFDGSFTPGATVAVLGGALTVACAYSYQTPPTLAAPFSSPPTVALATASLATGRIPQATFEFAVCS